MRCATAESQMVPLGVLRAREADEGRPNSTSPKRGLGANSHKMDSGRRRSRDHYLKGSLSCGECGSRMQLDYPANKQGVRHAYYCSFELPATSEAHRRLRVRDARQADRRTLRSPPNHHHQDR